MKEQSFYTFKSIPNEELVKELALSFFVGNMVWRFKLGHFGQVVGGLQWQSLVQSSSKVMNKVF